MLRQEFLKLITDSGMISLTDLKTVMRSKDTGAISELKFLSFAEFDDVKFAKMIAEKFNLRYMDLANAKVPPEVLASIKKDEVIKYRAIPIQKSPNLVLFAVYDPSIIAEAQGLRDITKCQVDFILTNLKSWSKFYEDIGSSVDDLLNSVEYITATDDEEGASRVKLEDIGEEIVHLVNKMMVEAFVRKASDIHLEPYDKSFRVRYRIDGELISQKSPPYRMMLPILSRVKILAQMDIAERRKPQDGRIKLKLAEDVIDFRVSSLPTLYGEKIVLRLLDRSNLQLDMTKLGFEAPQLKVFKESIHKPHGICLVTGPTGSGKTTTLYSALAELNSEDKNLSAAEDPVEFNIDGINQVNIRKDIGYTFAVALKAFLRQDPDIIMLGEIRDLETAQIAIEAALTGHLVLSTLHTNDCASTVTRLLNMGIEPFLITGALNVVVAQRLCRKICTGCREIEKIPPAFLVKCGIAASSAEKMKVFKGLGCNLCNNTGYKGRSAIYEVMPMTNNLREILISGGSAIEIKKQAIREGMKTLRMSALTKVAMGHTSLEEALTNSASD